MHQDAQGGTIPMPPLIASCSKHISCGLTTVPDTCALFWLLHPICLCKQTNTQIKTNTVLLLHMEHTQLLVAVKQNGHPAAGGSHSGNYTLQHTSTASAHGSGHNSSWNWVHSYDRAQACCPHAAAPCPVGFLTACLASAGRSRAAHALLFLGSCTRGCSDHSHAALGCWGWAVRGKRGEEGISGEHAAKSRTREAGGAPAPTRGAAEEKEEMVVGKLGRKRLPRAQRSPSARALLHPKARGCGSVQGRPAQPQARLCS